METLQQPALVVRVRSFDPRAARAARELVAHLSGDGYDVTLELPDPGQFSVQNSLDAIGIFIAGAASGKVIELAVERIFNSTTQWLRSRFAKDAEAGAMYVTLYGPDGKPLKNVLGRGVDHISNVTPPKDVD